MAGSSIKGITIEINGDTTGLTSALKGVNSQLNTTQNDLKQVEKLLKLDPKNTELLAQKQKLLNQAVAETRQKLDTLKNAATQANEQLQKGEITQAQYDALRREIIATEQSLESLERQASQSNATMQAIAATADQVASGAKKVADGTRALSTAASAALAGIGAAAYNAVTAADDLNTLAKQTGFTTAELQKMQYAADLVDVSVDDITGAAKKMKSAMASGSSTFAELGVQITNADGSMRNVNDVFYDCIAALSRIENETERDQVAMAIFGKSADSLAGIIDDGGESLRKYGDEAERAGLILSQDTLDSLNTVNDAIDQVKATASATLLETGAKAVEALLPVIDRIIDAIGRVLEWIGNLDSSQISMLVTILAIVAAISPVAGIIAGIAEAISAAIPIVTAINAAIAANPVVAICTVAAIAIAALVYLIIKYWDEIETAFDALVDSITAAWNYMVNWIVSAWKWAANALKSVWNGIINVGKSICNSIISLVENMINGVISRINSLISLINSVASAIASIVGLTYSGISTIRSVKLPKMATGGILRNGTALVGEAGPELLTVGNGQATVQPLSHNSSTGSATGLTDKLETSVYVKFEGTMAQLVQMLQPEIQAETIRRGSNLVRA